MQLEFIGQSLELGGRYLGASLRDSSRLLGDVEALRERMRREGYLLLRGLHDRVQVLRAGRLALDTLADGQVPAIADDLNGPTATTSAVPNETLAQAEIMGAVVLGSPIMGFFARLLGETPASFDYRWLRTAGPGAGSPIHCDRVFMGRGSTRLYTCWTPLCDVSFEMGPLVLCLGSHRLRPITQSYGQCDVDRDLIAGHFTEDPLELVDRFGARWATAEFKAGDAVVFNMHMLHASLTNTSETVRVSIDTRYQPASDPMDERWIGKVPLGHYAWKHPEANIEPLAQSRKRWRL